MKIVAEHVSGDRALAEAFSKLWGPFSKREAQEILARAVPEKLSDGMIRLWLPMSPSEAERYSHYWRSFWYDHYTDMFR